jgi:hypothetical protein
MRLRKVSFSGYEWWVKKSCGPVGPGDNYFSDSPDNVWVDAADRLHLKITQDDGIWYCSEVILNDCLGYGDYLFLFESQVGELDPNVVLGLFTWDSDSPSEDYREIDIEFSRWGVPSDTNAQYVVQPWYVPGNRHRWFMPTNMDSSTHRFNWREGQVQFLSVAGHQSCEPYDSVIHSWQYSSPDVPVPGTENIRINLWLYETVPPAQEVEVIVSAFSYYPPVGIDLSGELVGEQLLLSWSAASGATEYWIYGAENIAYLEPGFFPHYEFRLDVLPQSIGSWSSGLGIGDPNANWTYMIVAVNADGQQLLRSNLFGEYDFSTTSSVCLPSGIALGKGEDDP